MVRFGQPPQLDPNCSEQRDVWAYKVGGRWVIGPDRGSDHCWGYSKKTDKPMTEVDYCRSTFARHSTTTLGDWLV